jgi:ketosteroid isomerase-like protein
MSSESNKKVVLDFWDKFSQGRTKDVLAMMTDSATWWVAGSFPLSGTRDKKGMEELLKGIGDACEGPIKITPKGLTAEENRVAVEAESYVKLKNGRVYNNHYHFLIEVRDGKIDRIREYLDTMHTNAIFCTP